MEVDQKWFFNYSSCKFVGACNKLHVDDHYSSPSSVLILVAAMMVFFMKGGFLLVEISLAKSKRDRKIVVITKLIDAFACAFGFFLIGFDHVSQYVSKEDVSVRFFGVTDPLVFFYKFTFAASAATIVGGGLVTNRYKMRLPAAFISAFVVGGIIHPLLALLMWSDSCKSFSPYRFCINNNSKDGCFDGTYGTTDAPHSFWDRIYVLDFAGSGVVHMIGGVFGLVVCLFAKFHALRIKRQQGPGTAVEEEKPTGFWLWLYPVEVEENELVWDASLGVIILWFGWFAFNCGSADSMESGNNITDGKAAFYQIPSIIAVNMIIASAAAGAVAILIAAWAQARLRGHSVNASEVGNGLLAALVAITAGCPFIEPWGALLIGGIAVLVYHLGCWIEYVLGIKDTAKVVPVHGLCGLWGLISTGLFIVGNTPDCNLHEAFEGLCYCKLRLPPMSWGERMAGQLIGAGIMIGLSLLCSVALFGALYVIPIRPFVWLLSKVLPTKHNGDPLPPLKYYGGLLFSAPEEEDKEDLVRSSRPRTKYGAAENRDEKTPLLSKASGENQVLRAHENRGMKFRGKTTAITLDT